jgi:hypothetical protein
VQFSKKWIPLVCLNLGLFSDRKERIIHSHSRINASNFACGILAPSPGKGLKLGVD